jgi:ribonucleoside-diphosphate reductase beta chain
MPQDDADYRKIAEETKEDCVRLFVDAVEQEKSWAHYLFKDGSLIGLNCELLTDYVEWIANKRLAAIGLPMVYKSGANPLPWTQKWIAGAEVQDAPQEVSISKYITGATRQDLTETTFKGFML